MEIALKNADFRVDSERVWRWETVQGGGYKAVIKFELLADLDDQPQSANVHFAKTDQLGAVNLRGTGYASSDYAPQTLTAYDQGARVTAEVNVTGLAGFLLAKTAAAHGRHKSKDYYDIAFVLLHHDEMFDERGRSIPPMSCFVASACPLNYAQPSRTSLPISRTNAPKASRRTWSSS